MHNMDSSSLNYATPNGVLKLYEYEQAEAQMLVAIALNIANRKRIPEIDRPIFKGMTNDKIRMWIAQYS